MTQDSRKKHKEQQTLWFNIVYKEFIRDNKGHSNILTYIKTEYKGDIDYWAKVARWAGYKCIKRNGIYYFEA